MATPPFVLFAFYHNSQGKARPGIPAYRQQNQSCWDPIQPMELAA